MAGTVSYNGVQVSTDTPLGRELMNWERKPNYRPENHQYPRMLYFARKCADGVVRAEMPEPNQFNYTKEQMGILQRDTDAARAFNLSCQKTVQTEDDYRLAHGQGWRTSMADAVEAAKEAEYGLQNAAAARFTTGRAGSRRGARASAARRGT